MTDWQPVLHGALIRLRPLVEEDFEPLHRAASDPLVWEQHPESNRHERENFRRYFCSGLESKGAFAIIDQKTNHVIGSSRFTDHRSIPQSSIEIGYTFLTRDYWGKGHNRELKFLMLSHAFQFVEEVFFFIGETNHRSRKAMIKIGGREVNRVASPQLGERVISTVVYQMRKSDWTPHGAALLPEFEQPALSTSRLRLESIVESHASELCDLFRDPELHHYVPFEPLELRQLQERCGRWAKRRSSDGSEIWLNWAGRDKTTHKIIAHFQAGVKTNGTSSIGYLVDREFQGQGFATEGLKAVFSYLRDNLGVREVKAWADSRNEASHRLAKRLGMVQVQFIKDADFFKGATSDEYVFSKDLRHEN